MSDYFMLFGEQFVADMNAPLFLCSALLAYDAGYILGDWLLWVKREYLIYDAWVWPIVCLVFSGLFAIGFLYDAVSEVKIVAIVILVVLVIVGFLLSLAVDKFFSKSKKQKS